MVKEISFIAIWHFYLLDLEGKQLLDGSAHISFESCLQLLDMKLNDYGAALAKKFPDKKIILHQVTRLS
jgi:hypothetical protein